MTPTQPPAAPDELMRVAHRIVEEWKHSTHHDIYKHDFERLKETIHTALQSTRAQQERECSVLASNQCHDGYGDDWGNHRCREIDKLNAQVEALRDELKIRAKQLGVACLRHDLTHSLQCGHCFATMQEALEAIIDIGDKNGRPDFESRLTAHQIAKNALAETSSQAGIKEDTETMVSK